MKTLRPMVKKVYYQLVSSIIEKIIPKPYRFEYKFAENIRSNTYVDIRFKEARLRSITHQLDKTLTFKTIKKMEKLSTSIKKSIHEILEDPDHDLQTVKWCQNVLNEYDTLSRGEQLDENRLNALHATNASVLGTIIEQRRSIRSYKKAPVSQELIKIILQAGLWAPTGCNRQTIEYLQVENTPDIQYCQKIAGEGYSFPSEAPLATIILVDPRNYALPNQRHMAYLEGGAAIQNMLLMAHALGIGSCWLFWNGNNLQKHNEFIKRFSLPQWLLPVAMICFGYPDVMPKFGPERKSLDRSIHLVKTNE